MRALADPVQVVDGQLVTMCRACSARGDQKGSTTADRDILAITMGPASRTTRCPCGSELALGDARPVVTSDGAIAMRCPACDDRGYVAVVVTDEQQSSQQLAARGLRHRWPRYAMAAVLALVVTLAVRLASDAPPPAAALGSALVPPALAIAGGSASTASDLLPPELTGEDDLWGTEFGPDVDQVTRELFGEEAIEPTVEDLLEHSGPALEEMFPILADWVFPVQGSSEAFPLRTSRRFGAEREGVRNKECRRGHCGVDLGGKRGTPILAVAWGRVVRIQRDEDRPSGMYVKIEHPDSVITFYMHLDSISEELRVGAEIQPGEQVGTLGATGVLFSAPHLHFSLQIPGEARPIYIDPAPYLERALQNQAAE